MRAFNSCVPGKREATSRQISNWSGNVVVFAAILMTALMAILALSVDVGYAATTQPPLKRSTEGTAPAGAMQQHLADMTGGRHWSAPGGSSYSRRLEDAFEEIECLGLQLVQ